MVESDKEGGNEYNGSYKRGKEREIERYEDKMLHLYKPNDIYYRHIAGTIYAKMESESGGDSLYLQNAYKGLYEGYLKTNEQEMVGITIDRWSDVCEKIRKCRDAWNYERRDGQLRKMVWDCKDLNLSLCMLTVYTRHDVEEEEMIVYNYARLDNTVRLAKEDIEMMIDNINDIVYSL